MAFKPTVKSFSEVTIRLRQIGKYLDNVDKSLKMLRWDMLPKKKKKKNGGGQDPGSKPPSRWPP